MNTTKNDLKNVQSARLGGEGVEAVTLTAVTLYLSKTGSGPTPTHPEKFREWKQSRLQHWGVQEGDWPARHKLPCESTETAVSKTMTHKPILMPLSRRGHTCEL